MLKIGKVYLNQLEGESRLCADISLNGRGTTLWFGVVPEQEEYLCAERSDAFVMVLLPTAMREGQDISCETPMSERLHYQLEHYLIPTLASAGTMYRRVSIRAPLTNERLQNKVGVGIGFSGTLGSGGTVKAHGADSAYPLTHLMLFNVGVLEEKAFLGYCADAQDFAKEMELEPIVLDSNLSEVLTEHFAEVSSFRNLAGVLALQGVFSVYLHVSERDIASFSLDLHNCAAYDLLTTNCAQTETLVIYLADDADMEERP